METVLVHYEEMHIQHHVARFAVRQGMWTVVKNLCKGYRDFHKASEADPSLLRESVERVAADADAADAVAEEAAEASGSGRGESLLPPTAMQKLRIVTIGVSGGR